MSIDNERNYNFELKSLTPTDDAENSELYVKVLDDALNNSKHYNIALTGGFGSGKSSILETFIRRSLNERNSQNLFKRTFVKSKYRFLRVSLADFNLDETKKESSQFFKNISNAVKGIEKKEQISIEVSILQQLIHQAKRKSTYYSSFRGKYPNRNRALFLTFFIVLFASSLLSNLQISSLSFLPDWGIWSNYFSLVFTLISGSALIYYLVDFLIKSKVRRIDVKPLNLELSDQVSILNAYIDEIISIFKNDRFNVVILEDIDRVSSHDIFIKLREINNLLRYSSETKSLGVKFIYAIKESIFLNEKEKNKFFDLIIPVIPYVNCENSKDKLRDSLLEEINDLNEYQTNRIEELIKYCSYVIDDMRTINNISNEFHIYKNNLNDNSDHPDLNRVKLLAMVVYKNLFPRDFEKIHSGQSALKDLFESRQIFEEKFKKDNSKRIEELSKENDSLKQRKKDSLKSLREEYIKEISTIIKGPNDKLNHDFELTELINDQYFERLINNEIELIVNDHVEKLNFSILEKNVNEKSYKTRCEEIRRKSDREYILTWKEIIKLRTANKNISVTPLSELPFEFDAEKLLDNKIISDETLLNEYEGLKLKLAKLLISESFIEKDFKDYVTKFYPGSLSSSDRNYLLSIRTGKQIDYNYSLDKIGNVLSEIIISDWRKGVYLNISLLEHILRNERALDLENYIRNFSVDKENTLEFLNVFIPFTSFKSKFIKYLVKYWPEYLVESYQGDLGNIDMGVFDSTIAYILLDSDEKDLFNYEDIDIFSDYISRKENFIQLLVECKKSTKQNATKLAKVLIDLEIEFSVLNFGNKKSNWVTDIIYKNNLYLLKPSIIQKIYELYIGEHKNTRVNYSSIMENGSTPLKNYIESNKANYLRCLREESAPDLKLYEDTEYFIDLLKSSAGKEDKKFLIKNIVNQEINVSEVGSENWVYLLDYRVISPSWKNIADIYSQLDMHASLVDILHEEKWVDELDSLNIEDDINTEVLDKNRFFEKYLKLNIEKSALNKLLNKITFYLSEEVVSESTPVNLKVLIDGGHVNLKMEVYESIADKDIEIDGVKASLYYLSHFQSDIIEENNDEFLIFNLNQIIEVIESELFSDDFISGCFDNHLEIDQSTLNQKDARLLQVAMMKVENYPEQILDFVIDYLTDKNQIELFNHFADKQYLSQNSALEMLKKFNRNLSRLYFPLKEVPLNDNASNNAFAKCLMELNLVSSKPRKTQENKIRIKRNKVSYDG